MQLHPAANEPGPQSPSALLWPRRVDFLPPGYPGRDVLLSLPALDDGGIDFDTALAACGVVAGNRWSDGFFSSDKPGAVRVQRPDDGVLRDPEYFFQLPGPVPYAVVPRFAHWRFPHNDLPAVWQRWASNSTAAREENKATGRCVLSNYADGLDMAHLIPTAEEDWWFANQMQRYSPTYQVATDPIDGPANLLTLRADLHRVFRAGKFCFVPKEREKIVRNDDSYNRDDYEHNNGDDHGNNNGSDDEKNNGHDHGKSNKDGDDNNNAASTNYNDLTPEPAPPQLVPHIFNSTPSGQLPTLWHNRTLHPIPSAVSVECLFARFAWTILSPCVFDTFLPSTPVPRRVLLVKPESRDWIVEEASREMCRKMWRAARSRSPKKRSIPRSAEAADELLAESSLSPSDSGYFGTNAFEHFSCYDHDFGPAEAQEAEPRGRSRKRRFSAGEQHTKDSGQSHLRKKALFSTASRQSES